ncbi:MAG: hypothetical protein JSW51_09300 [Gemmatimonadota bacterium]|nr:MAG: hypothetical protein JSW51_09300 [Gemmatimonadota bacterium]
MTTMWRSGGHVLLATAVTLGCEPASVLEARDQLGRGGEREVEYVLPVIADTFSVEGLLDSAVVVNTTDGLLGIRLDTRVLAYGVGVFAPFVSFGDSIPIVAHQELVQNASLNQMDFGDVEDVIRQVDMNDARLRVNVSNTADIAAVLVDFNLGAAELDANGLLPQPVVYETDSLAAPILVPVAEAGQNSLTIAANSDTTFTLQGGPLVNRLVHMVLDGRRAAVVGAGILTTDAVTGQITGTDVINVETELVAVVDFTLPDTGVVFTKNTTQDGLSIDAVEVPSILERLREARVNSGILNNLPFSIDIDIAFAPGDLGNSADVFAHPDAVVVSRMTVDTTTVDALGRPIAAQLTNAEVSLVGDELSALLGDQFTATMRLRLRGAAASNRRGVVLAGTNLLVNSSARIVLRLGVSQ